jgi:hypothetical protein
MTELDEQAAMIVLGTLRELITHRKYAYISNMSDYKFSHLEGPGKEMAVNLVESVLPMLAKARDLQIKEEAEKLMLEKLSK